MRVISGLLAPSGGQFAFEDRNLTGLPYDFDVQRGLRHVPYSMRAHGDALHFAVLNGTGTAPAGSIALQAAAQNDTSWSQHLVQAGLATGAFPFLLRPYVINRPFSDYTSSPQYWRQDFAVRDIDGVSRLVVGQSAPILPQPPVADMDAQGSFRYLAVDGALIDNEPLEIARRELASGQRNPRSSRDSRRAVILVNPFGSDRIGWRRKDRDPATATKSDTSDRAPSRQQFRRTRSRQPHHEEPAQRTRPRRARVRARAAEGAANGLGAH